MKLRKARTSQAHDMEPSRGPSHGEGGKVVPFALSCREGAHRGDRSTGAGRVPSPARPKELEALRASGTLLGPSELVRCASRGSNPMPGKGSVAGGPRNRWQIGTQSVESPDVIVQRARACRPSFGRRRKTSREVVIDHFIGSLYQQPYCRQYAGLRR
jgi:hypothetical protein